MTDLVFSPLDQRYANDLPAVLSEQAFLRFQVEVEKQYLLALMEKGLCPRVEEAELEKIFDGLSFEEIEKIEKTTQHATRALVEALAQRLQKAGHPQASHWVHVGITSFDTVDTATRLRLKSFFERDYYKALDGLQSELRRWAHLHATTEQVGRTHGQWAVPSYFGLIFAEAHERIAHLRDQLKISVNDLRGQASGAVGSYQALGLLVKEPMNFEENFLLRLKLKPHFSSTQILPPEDIVTTAQIAFNIGSVIAKLATDLRNLARSEIAEIAEGLAPGQVGSSTMPQKRNPWNLEHVCSLFKVLQSRLNLLQNDMISEHQRDLTNSASGRFYIETFGLAYLMIKRLTKVLSRLEAFPQNMQKHLDSAGSTVFAEAFYVLATKAGFPDAHEKVRECARESERSGATLFEVAQKQGIVPPGLDLQKLKEEIYHGPKSKMDSVIREWRLEYDKGHDKNTKSQERGQN